MSFYLTRNPITSWVLKMRYTVGLLIVHYTLLSNLISTSDTHTTVDSGGLKLTLTKKLSNLSLFWSHYNDFELMAVFILTQRTPWRTEGEKGLFEAGGGKLFKLGAAPPGMGWILLIFFGLLSNSCLHLLFFACTVQFWVNFLTSMNLHVSNSCSHLLFLSVR